MKHAPVVPGRQVTGPGLKLTARSQSIQLLWAQAQSNFRVFFYQGLDIVTLYCDTFLESLGPWEYNKTVFKIFNPSGLNWGRS